MTLQSNIDTESWVSASMVHNYMLDDPILDYLNLVLPTKKDEFLEFIMNQGNLFEKTLMSKVFIGDLKYIQISYGQQDILKHSKFIETVELIKKGTPIIYQGVLHDCETNTYGSPDILIRSDYINKLVPGTLDKSDIYKGLNKYHYIVIDIKFTTLHFKADGIHLLNEGRMRANKGQILVYNRILSKIQNFIAPYFFVMGRSWKHRELSGSSAIEKLGRIDILDKDKDIPEKLDKSLEWLFKLKKNYKIWSQYYDPIHPEKGWPQNSDIGQNPLISDIDQNLLISEISELYPNMCNTNDSPYSDIKQKISKYIQEITMVWNVGFSDRISAHKNGIKKWSDPKLIEMFSKDTVKNATIKKILEINQNEVCKLKNYNIPKLKKTGVGEFYIDFETMTNIFDDMSEIPKVKPTNLVFMIGLLYVHENGQEEYFNFTAQELSDIGEYQIFRDLCHTITSIVLQCRASDNLKDFKFYHYGHIENYTYRKILEKYKESAFIELVFCDLLEIVRSEPVVIKNVFGFSLKELGRELIRNGSIPDINWSDECSSGLSAMIQAKKCYQNSGLNENPIMKGIMSYNKIDCYMMYLFIKYLRNLA